MENPALKAAISLISTALALPALAIGTCSPGVVAYNATATSGDVTVTSSFPTEIYYVDNASGTASNKSDPPVTLITSSSWCIDTTTGNFSGNIVYGNYKTQTNVSGSAPPVAINIDGRQTYTSVVQSFSGTGTWSANHFTWSYMNPTVNAGGASVQTETSSSCANGATHILQKVCNSFATTTPSWEGLTLDFYFFNNYYYFTGLLTASNTSGAGLWANTTTIDWLIAGIDPPAVPIPAAAWLFGSGLVGLAAARRKCRRH